MNLASHRRRIAAGLIGYGVVGILLFAVSIPLLFGPLTAIGRIAGQQGDAVRWLDVTSQGLEDAAHGAANAGASLASAAAAARNAASLARELSASMAALRDASGLTILGSQPFGGLTGDFDRAASRADDLASSMQSLAGMLDRDTTDFSAIAADVTSLRGQAEQLRATVASDFGGVGTLGAWLLPVALLLLMWLATPAVVSLVVGIWLLRDRAATIRDRAATT